MGPKISDLYRCAEYYQHTPVAVSNCVGAGSKARAHTQGEEQMFYAAAGSVTGAGAGLFFRSFSTIGDICAPTPSQ
jgi:hypothetical protein